MEFSLEAFDKNKHDVRTVARLIFESDPVFNTIVYGKNAFSVIEKMLHLGDNYFDPSYTSCAILEGTVAAVVVSFPLSEKAEIDQKSGKAFAQAMGLFAFLSRMPLYLRMEKMMPRVEASSGSYILFISVDSEKRGGGIGSKIIQQLSSDQGALYLHVNRDKSSAIRFYEKNGFHALAEGSMHYKGKELSQVLMEKT